MKEDFQVEKEISIVEIFRALLSKILYLILALILGACAGGVYGYFTAKDVVIYGTQITYNVQPVPKGLDTGDGASGDSIFAHYGSYSATSMGNMVKSLESEVFAGMLLVNMMDRNAEKKAAGQEYLKGLPAARTYANGNLTEEYKTWLRKVAAAVTFKNTTEGNIAESFIYVHLSMNGDENNAMGKATLEEILVSVMDLVPEFIVTNMQLPSDYKETKCVLHTEIFDILPTNGTYASDQMTKLAIIAGAIALVIAAAIVIALHMSDKRLRDVDVLPKVFNVPLLGVIPTIDEEALKHYDTDKGGKA